MRKLRNVLFVQSKDIYCGLDGENVVGYRDNKQVARFPLHTIEDIVIFSYLGASPALLGKCAKEGIGVTFLTQNGRFLARTTGENNGNVLLRRKQYKMADSAVERAEIGRNILYAKVYNETKALQRLRREHPMQSEEHIDAAIVSLKGAQKNVLDAEDVDSMRGFEGAAASVYFSCFDDMILRNKSVFRFHGRSKRPPMDEVNALLSFCYVLLSNSCASALASVGLDPYVGFVHADRPGRSSLALDLVEELRTPIAERIVLTLINRGQVDKNDFLKQESGAVYLNDDGRQKVITAWHEKRQESLLHPYLQEKMEWGLIPYAQALLLSRYVRGDLDGYPPFLWR